MLILQDSEDLIAVYHHYKEHVNIFKGIRPHHVKKLFGSIEHQIIQLNQYYDHLDEKDAGKNPDPKRAPTFYTLRNSGKRKSTDDEINSSQIENKRTKIADDDGRTSTRCRDEVSKHFVCLVPKSDYPKATGNSSTVWNQIEKEITIIDDNLSTSICRLEKKVTKKHSQDEIDNELGLFGAYCFEPRGKDNNQIFAILNANDQNLAKLLKKYRKEEKGLSNMDKIEQLFETSCIRHRCSGDLGVILEKNEDPVWVKYPKNLDFVLRHKMLDVSKRLFSTL